MSGSWSAGKGASGGQKKKSAETLGPTVRCVTFNVVILATRVAFIELRYYHVWMFVTTKPSTVNVQTVETKTYDIVNLRLFHSCTLTSLADNILPSHPVLANTISLLM